MFSKSFNHLSMKSSAHNTYHHIIPTKLKTCDKVIISSTKLGAGTNGTVYLGTYYKKLAAIKVYFKSSKNLFAQLQNDISTYHNFDYVMKVKWYGLAQFNSKPVFVTVLDYYPNKDFFYWYNRLPDFIKFNIYEESALGILDLHTNRYAHRDIKMDNILLTNFFDAVITDLDFGCITQNGMAENKLIGTSLYLAPEIFNPSSNRQIDLTKADVYSFGCMLFLSCYATEFLIRFNNLANKNPNNSNVNYAEEKQLKAYNKNQKSVFYRIVKNILDNTFKSSNSLKTSDTFNRLILKCINDDPTERPSIKEVVESLHQIRLDYYISWQNKLYTSFHFLIKHTSDTTIFTFTYLLSLMPNDTQIQTIIFLKQALFNLIKKFYDPALINFKKNYKEQIMSIQNLIKNFHELIIKTPINSQVASDIQPSPKIDFYSNASECFFFRSFLKREISHRTRLSASVSETIEEYANGPKLEFNFPKL